VKSTVAAGPGESEMAKVYAAQLLAMEDESQARVAKRVADFQNRLGGLAKTIIDGPEDSILSSAMAHEMEHSASGATGANGKPTPAAVNAQESKGGRGAEFVGLTDLIKRIQTSATKSWEQKQVDLAEKQLRVQERMANALEDGTGLALS
jgi:hypothetical protein